MDLGSILGWLLAFSMIVMGILLGSSIMDFVQISSLAIVFGACTGIVFVAYPPSQVKTAFGAFKNVFKEREHDPKAVIELLAELSKRARREGLLSLESAADEADDEFFERGLRLVVDGPEASVVEEVLYGELEKIEERHKQSISFWDDLGIYGPAMGLIGTLIGLVQMLQQMDDPTKIGPAMAVALLTTFYGSIIANMIGIPVAMKLSKRSAQEISEKTLIAQGLLSILAGENPRFMVERLNATLAPDDRWQEAA
jgi:chemotaxis protein MotA